jgi:aspartyl/glutamyl-tRNA(Asn/Gln) amidotransferase C subunit
MISLEEVKKLGLLARIELDKKEAEELQRELGQILDYVSKLKKAPIREAGASETLKNVFREDEPINDESEIKKGEYVRVKHIL